MSYLLLSEFLFKNNDLDLNMKKKLKNLEKKYQTLRNNGKTEKAIEISKEIQRIRKEL